MGSGYSNWQHEGLLSPSVPISGCDDGIPEWECVSKTTNRETGWLAIFYRTRLRNQRKVRLLKRATRRLFWIEMCFLLSRKKSCRTSRFATIPSQVLLTFRDFYYSAGAKKCFIYGWLQASPTLTGSIVGPFTGHLECQAACASHSDCEAFTWAKVDGRCHLKRKDTVVKAGAKDKYVLGNISGPKYCAIGTHTLISEDLENLARFW